MPNAERPWLCADVPISHAPRTLHGGVRLLRFAEFAGVQQTDVDHVSEQMQALELPESGIVGRCFFKLSRARGATRPELWAWQAGSSVL